MTLNQCPACFWLLYCETVFARPLTGSCLYAPSCYVKAEAENCRAAPPEARALPYIRAVALNLIENASPAPAKAWVNSDISDASPPLSAGGGNQLQLAERYLIVDALRRCGWRQDRAARLLGVTPRVLNYKIHVVYKIQHESWKNWVEEDLP